MSQQKPLTVAEALSPHRRIQKRPRIELVACPICRRRMSTILLDSHIDRCKPPRRRFSPPAITPLQSATQVSTQSTTAATPPPTQTSTPPSTATRPQSPATPPPLLTQSHLIPPSQPPSLYFVMCRNPLCSSFRHSPCSTCATMPPVFSALILLRNLSGSPTTHLHLHQCTPSKPWLIPPLPPGSPAARLSHSILLSALQKCIRRRLAYPAVRVAITLIRKRRSLFDLLRRLTVISLEDAVLHPNFPELVWLFAAAGKAHRPSKDDMQLVLNAVYQLATAKATDVGVRENKIGEQIEEGGELVQALRVRACYGGMSGDTALLKAAADLWARRLREDGTKWHEFLGRLFGSAPTDVIPEERWAPLFQENNAVLRPGDIPPAAWDMHCCSIADEVAKSVLEGNGEIIERFGGGPDEVRVGIEKLMWKYRSSVSNKRPFEGLQEGLKAEEESFVVEDEVCMSVDEVLWKTELESLVNDWCRKNRRKYGL